MDVFSLLKFWRDVGGGGPIPAGDFNSSIDDDDSFFDLVFTNTSDENDNDDCDASAQVDCECDSKSSSDEVYLRNKRKILPLDDSSGNNKFRLEKKEANCEIEEIKIGSLLKRDNSLREKLRTEKLLDDAQTMPSKRFSKDVVSRYLNLIKPTYVKVSKKNTLSEKSITPSSSPASSAFSPRKEEKIGGRGAVFREVRKRLGKSRSASAILQTPAKTRDDWALEKQDQIQSAILHCKRSFNSP